MSRSDARTLDPAAQEQLRFQAVRLREAGRSLAEVAEICGVQPSKISQWHMRYRREGPDALRRRKRGRRSGTQRRLNARQEAQLQRWIVHQTPAQLRFPFMLWTRRVVGALIEREFGVNLSLPTIGRYLVRWGMTPQRPLKRALEQNPVAVREWLNTLYPAIQRRAKVEGAELYWGGETGLRSDSALGRGFAPVRQDAGRDTGGQAGARRGDVGGE